MMAPGPPASLALRVFDRSLRRGALIASRGGMSITLHSSVQRRASGGSPRGVKPAQEGEGQGVGPKLARKADTTVIVSIWGLRSSAKPTSEFTVMD